MSTFLSSTGCSIITMLFISQISNTSTLVWCMGSLMPASFFFFHNIYTSMFFCSMGSLMPYLLLFFHNIYTGKFVWSMGSSMTASLFFFHNIYMITFICYMVSFMPAPFLLLHILTVTNSLVCFLCTSISITCRIGLFTLFLLPFYRFLSFISPFPLCPPSPPQGLFNLRAIYRIF